MRGAAARGKTVIFATHYLEEADAYADRIVMIARGRIVADGPATEIKARAGGRTIRATLPGADMAQVAAIAGVSSADLRGDAVILACADAEMALRGLLDRFPAARDVEVRGAGLEEAFLALTADEDVVRSCEGQEVLLAGYTYLRYEVLRNFRVWQFIFFSLAWPLVLFFTVAGANRRAVFDGIGFPLYFMTGMAAVGTMTAVVSRGSLIAAERSVGWTRQLRITPLTAGATSVRRCSADT
jgi:hypothetical protein